MAIGAPGPGALAHLSHEGVVQLALVSVPVQARADRGGDIAADRHSVYPHQPLDRALAFAAQP